MKSHPISFTIVIILTFISLAYAGFDSSHDPQKSKLSFEGEGEYFLCLNSGQCEQCTEEDIAKNEPFCMPYSNKQPVKCHFLVSEKEYEHDLPRWRSCRRVPGLERWRFLEFTLINAFVAFVACLAFMWRTRTLAAIQYRKLAARIGIVNV